MLKKSAQKASTTNGEFRSAPVPDTNRLSEVEDAAKHCRACPLYKLGTQTVFGEGPKRATMMLIGEQPGDQEDLAGKPFVGPAGKLLDKCLQEAGIDRRKVYVTNAVKHFKWEPRGKLRIHKKPSMKEVHACRPWLEAELEVVRPSLVVCLGAVAAQSLLGSGFKVTQSHGKLQHRESFPPIIATIHPSAILRARTPEDRDRDTNVLLDDLRRANTFLAR